MRTDKPKKLHELTEGVTLKAAYDPEAYDGMINEALVFEEQEIGITSPFDKVVGRGRFYLDKCELAEGEWEASYALQWTQGPFWMYWTLGDFYNCDLSTFRVPFKHIQFDESVEGMLIDYVHYFMYPLSHIEYNYAQWQTLCIPANGDMEAPYCHHEGTVIGYKEQDQG